MSTLRHIYGPYILFKMSLTVGLIRGPLSVSVKIYGTYTFFEIDIESRITCSLLSVPSLWCSHQTHTLTEGGSLPETTGCLLLLSLSPRCDIYVTYTIFEGGLKSGRSCSLSCVTTFWQTDITLTFSRTRIGRGTQSSECLQNWSALRHYGYNF